MKKFVRQNPNNTAAADITIDFGAASAQIARVLDPEVYNLRIEFAPRGSKKPEHTRRARTHRGRKRRTRCHPTDLGGRAERQRWPARCRK